jgi:hypothetical protein
MPRSTKLSAIVTLRISPALNRSIEREARRRRGTKSAVLREILESAFRREQATDPAHEARRQSLLVSGRASEKDALEFIERAADYRG